MHQQHQEKSSWTSQSQLIKKRTINTRNASTTPREELMNITITIDYEEDDQHSKCKNNTKKKVHEHHDHVWPKGGPSTQEMHQQLEERSFQESWPSMTIAITFGKRKENA
jgi:hypothetical protein